MTYVYTDVRVNRPSRALTVVGAGSRLSFHPSLTRIHRDTNCLQLRKEAVGGSAATRIQCIYRGYSAR